MAIALAMDPKAVGRFVSASFIASSACGTASASERRHSGRWPSVAADQAR